jgi:hypothetical protein
MKKNSLLIILYVVIFAIAMGYLESAVVVYIREIYYPEGFAFPLKMMSERVMVTEIFREFATLVMLAGIGIMAGRSRLERFGMFLFAFGIWDIFYYVFLYALIGWPESLFTWDILFLLPTTWVGPVLAPCINALTMVIFGGLIWHFQSVGKLKPIKAREWILLIPGSLVLIGAYVQDYVRLMRAEFSLIEIFSPSDAAKLMEYAMLYVPVHFSWWIFWIGQGLILVGIGYWVLGIRKNPFNNLRESAPLKSA